MWRPHELLRDRSDSLRTPESSNCLPTKNKKILTSWMQSKQKYGLFHMTWDILSEHSFQFSAIQSSIQQPVCMLQLISLIFTPTTSVITKVKVREYKLERFNELRQLAGNKVFYYIRFCQQTYEMPASQYHNLTIFDYLQWCGMQMAYSPEKDFAPRNTIIIITYK